MRRRQSLISSTLGSCHAFVTVEYVKSGVIHYITRDADSGRLSLRIGDGHAAETAPDTLVQSIASIQGYSQKQLSHVSVRTSELVRLLTAPIGQDLGLLTSRIGSLAGRLRQVFADSETKRGLEGQYRILHTEVESKRSQLDSLRSQLGDLPADVRGDLDAHAGFQAGASVLSHFAKALAESGEALQEARIAIGQQLESLPVVDEAWPVEDLRELRGSVSEALTGTVAALESVEGYLELAAVASGALRTKIAQAHAEHETRYASAASEEDHQTARIGLLRTLSAAIEEATRKSLELTSQIRRLR